MGRPFPFLSGSAGRLSVRLPALYRDEPCLRRHGRAARRLPLVEHGAFDTMLTPHAAYLALGTNPDERQQRYRMLFREQLGQQVLEDIRDATRGNFVLGNPKFAAEVAVALGRRASRGKAGRPRPTAKDQAGSIGRTVLTPPCRVTHAPIPTASSVQRAASPAWTEGQRSPLRFMAPNAMFSPEYR